MCTVLVVDDEKLIRWSLAELLRAAGFQVLSARDGAEALEAFHAGVCLALLDYNLPGSTGVEVLEEFRKAGSQCQVVVMSAKPSETTEAEALRNGANRYIDKPVDLTELVTVVVDTLRARCQVRNAEISLGACQFFV